VDISDAQDLGVLSLLMGKYVVVAKAQFNVNVEQVETTVECTLVGGGDIIDESAVRLISPAISTLALSAAVDLTTDGSVALNCQGDQVFASRVKLTAIQVDSVSFP
jgi:hypothetical protein